MVNGRIYEVRTKIFLRFPEQYEAKYPEKAGREFKLMLKTAKQIKKNFRFMKIKHGKVSPARTNNIEPKFCVLEQSGKFL